jgi:hypothetical protein
MFSITGDYASVDTSRFDHRLNIEDVYSEIVSPANATSNPIYSIPNGKWIKSEENFNSPEYSVIDLSKKYEERMRKQKNKEDENDKNLSAMLSNLNIYEDIQFSKEINHVDKNIEDNIYEPVMKS